MVILIYSLCVCVCVIVMVSSDAKQNGLTIDRYNWSLHLHGHF